MDTTFDHTRLSQFDTGTLLRTAKWARLIGIIGLVMGGLMAVLSFFIGGFFVRMIAMQQAAMGLQGMQPGMADSMLKGIGTMYTVVFLISAAIYIVPSWLLYRFGANTRSALSGAFDPTVFSAGLTAHRRMYTFMGVLTLILLAFYALALIAGLVFWAAMPAMPTMPAYEM